MPHPRCLIRWILVATLGLWPAALDGQDSRSDGGPASRSESAPARIFGASARWIWDGGEPKPVDAYRVFRKEFALRAAPDRATIRITADTEYRLYVNGTYAGRGPAPSPAGCASVDAIDVGARLRAGENELSVIVHHVGAPTFSRAMGRAGLIAELAIPDEPPVVTDASWGWRHAWWIPTGERLSPMRVFTEHLDARRQPAPDDRAAAVGWSSAVPIGPEGIAPWPVLEPRDIAMPDHREVPPLMALFAGSCDPAVPPKKDAAKLLAALPQGPSQSAALVAASGLTESHNTGFRIDARSQGVVIGLDFGREVSGFPEVSADADADGVVLDLGYGEGLDPGGFVSVFRQDGPHCDRMTLRRGRQTLRVFHHRAFRYLVLAVRGGLVKVEGVRVIESGFPVQERGAFSCDDRLLDRIWKAGHRTVAVCMDQGFMDCPWRERGQYVGDALVEAPVARDVFGDASLARRFLRQAASCQPEDGLLPPAYPCDWIAWMKDQGPRRIPGYGALWIVMLEEHWRATGDLELVRGLAPVVDRQLGWFDRFRAPNGLVTSAPEWNFIDWAELSPATALACLNLQYLMALRAAAALDVALGRGSTRAAEARRVAEAFHATCWDEGRGLYHDGPGKFSVHTNALALIAVGQEAAVAKRIIDQLGSDDLVQPATPYFEGFVLRALARHGRHEDALERIRRLWGPMLGGGGTFWEAFAPKWSLCHGWSSAPTSFLQREVLGLQYDAPRRTVTFAPRLAGLAWAHGSSPFTCGDSWAEAFARPPAGMAGSRVEFAGRISVPPGIALEVDLPASRGATLEVDGERVPSEQAVMGRLRATLPGGAHRLRVVRP